MVLLSLGKLLQGHTCKKSIFSYVSSLLFSFSLLNWTFCCYCGCFEWCCSYIGSLYYFCYYDWFNEFVSPLHECWWWGPIWPGWWCFWCFGCCLHVGQCLLDGEYVPETTVFCEKQVGCRAIQKTGHCCPDYKCGKFCCFHFFVVLFFYRKMSTFPPTVKSKHTYHEFRSREPTQRLCYRNGGIINLWNTLRSILRRVLFGFIQNYDNI